MLLDNGAVHLAQDLEEQAERVREEHDLALVDAAHRHVRVFCHHDNEDNKQ
jgi:hypothetical protein